MRDYLQYFFEEFDFPARDGAELLAAYDAIVANDASRAAWERLMAAYDADCACDIAQMREEAGDLASAVRIHRYTAKLLFFICSSLRFFVS